ncbi:response regulator transcription factor [Vibrio sp. D404a]|uniref:response regulator transcription factor n=2 Tax=Vibrio TaxID=662 RepID=UPI002555AE63|nr:MULTISPECIES: response regulator transcription factor [unclassified Vibrio]MDK9735746.1 response regulator transcription factor [Vibrio sp. D404a]MDK9798662.1 response regulator transcription factor [Vibrio sp. D449a]
MKLLIVEDHPELSKLLKTELSHLGHIADQAASGKQALHLLTISRYDAVLLDLGLPDIDGMQLLSQLRKNETNDIPVIVISARDALESRLEALNLGADDYLTKPFNTMELEARLRTILRRSSDRMDDLIKFGDLVFNRTDRVLSTNVDTLVLAKRESMLVEALMKSAPRIVIKDNLEENLYGIDESSSTNAVEALISRLRRKLKELKSQCTIETKRGIGYRLVCADEG